MNPADINADINNDNVFRYELDVRFFEVDSLGVVFNMWDLGWCDEAMSAFMASIGYGYATLRAQGFDAVLRNAQVEWVNSLQAFQHAEIAVRVEHVGTTSFRIGYDIERVARPGLPGNPVPERTRCAHVSVTYVCVEVEGRGKVPIPGGLHEAFMRNHTSSTRQPSAAAGGQTLTAAAACG